MLDVLCSLDSVCDALRTLASVRGVFDVLRTLDSVCDIIDGLRKLDSVRGVLLGAWRSGSRRGSKAQSREETTSGQRFEHGSGSLYPVCLKQLSPDSACSNCHLVHEPIP